MPNLTQNSGRKHRVLVSNIPPDTSMSQMRDLLQHLFPKIKPYVTGLRDQPVGKPMQATLLCKTEHQARETKDELHMFTFNGYKLRTSMIDSLLPPRAEKSNRKNEALQEELMKIERAKLALEEKQREVLRKMKDTKSSKVPTNTLQKKPTQKLNPVVEIEKGKKHGKYSVSEDVMSAYEISDEFGKSIDLTGPKKKNMESAVRAICNDFEKIIPEAFIPAELKDDFDVLVREKVRGNMIAMMADEPVMCPTKYVLKYRVKYPLQKTFPFLQSMRDQLYNQPRHANAPKPKATKFRTSEKAKRAGESIENIKDEPHYLEWIQQTANNNCWYMDYTLGKVLRKAFENVKNDDTIDYEINSSEEGDESEEKAIKAEESDEKYKDFSNIQVEELMEKIEAYEDMDSIKRYIDIRLAFLLNKIRTEIILAATRGPGRVVLQPRMKQLGLDGQQLKSWRKIRYATLATHTAATNAFMQQYSIVGSWQSRPFKTLKYAQNNVGLVSKIQYKNLLRRHMHFFHGYKLAVVKSFPDDDDEESDDDEKTQVDEVEMDRDHSLAKDQPVDDPTMDTTGEDATMDTTAEETDYAMDEMSEEPDSVPLEA